MKSKRANISGSPDGFRSLAAWESTGSLSSLGLARRWKGHHQPTDTGTSFKMEVEQHLALDFVGINKPQVASDMFT